MSHKSTRGFTLVELMVTVALVGVLAAAAGTALMYGVGRARLNNLAFEISALVPVAQMRATSRGTPHYLVFTEGQVTLLEMPGTPPDFSAARLSELLNPDEATTPNRVVERVQWEPQALRYAPLGDRPVLPPPFQAVPVRGAGADGMLAACTFCVAGTEGPRGVLGFRPDGTVAPVTGVGEGGAVSFVASRPGETPVPRLIAIAAPAGALKVF